MFQTGQTSFKASLPAAVVSKRDANTRVVEVHFKMRVSSEITVTICISKCEIPYRRTYIIRCSIIIFYNARKL